MKVILKDNIEYLGKKGDIVKVAPGYGRNYLLPKKLALEVTATNMKMIEMVQKSLRKGLEKEMKVYQSLIEKLNAVTLTFLRKSGEKDTIFGSVSVTDIRDALAELNFEVEKKRILLDEPIKRLGNYTVPIKVFHDDRAEIKLEVAREGGPDEEEPTAPETETEPVPMAAPVAAETEGVTDTAPEAEEPEAAPEIPEEPAEPAETKPEESAPEAPEEKAEEQAPASPETETEPAAEAQEPGPESTEQEPETDDPAAESQETEAGTPEPDAEIPELEKTEGIPTEEPSPEPEEKEETSTEEPLAEPEVPEENSKETDKKP